MLKDEVIKWIKGIFDESGMHHAFIGMSGGADSTVCGAALVQALGAEHVHGILMPNGVQKDMDDAFAACDAAGITDYCVKNIAPVYNAFAGLVPELGESKQASTNLPPRIRMATLYLMAQTRFPHDSLVCCTGNMSELYLGYCTLWGDLAGDFAPIANISKTDVRKLGIELGLPENLVMKAPADGLTGSTDEDNFGFSYVEFDKILPLVRASVDVGVEMQVDPEYAQVYSKAKEMAFRNAFKHCIVSIPSPMYRADDVR